MGNFKGYKSIIDELQILAEKLDKSSLTKEELLKFKKRTRDLYERTVILHFKAIEETVYSSRKKEETIHDSTRSSMASKADHSLEEENTPTFDFSDSNSESAKPSDGFSFDFTDEEIEENKIEKKDEVSPSSNDNEGNEKIESLEAEEVKETPKTTITTEKRTEISSDDQVLSFYEKFTQVHDESILAMLGSQKIDSLKGAFGLNDKLQIINELFSGDADKYAETIESLDDLSSDEEARRKLSEIAAHHQWEPDHRLVEDFAKMIERRYAK